MIQNAEPKKSFNNLVDKISVYQICASLTRTRPVECRKNQAELIEIYRVLLQGNFAEFKNKYEHLNQTIDQKIESLEPSDRHEYNRFMEFKQECAKTEINVNDLNNKITQLIDKVESRTFILAPVLAKEPVEQKTTKAVRRGRKSDTAGEKASRVWKVIETVPVNEEVSGRQIAEKMGFKKLTDVKSVSDSLRHLFNQKRLKRRLIRNQYFYWREK
jgi:hypothetical protein